MSALICDPVYRAGDPDFTSSSPLSGRLLFVRRGTDRTWVWGGSGSLLIRLAWEAFMLTLPDPRAEMAGLGRLGVYGVTGSSLRRTYTMSLGESVWGDNFTRALWSFYFRIWQDQTERLRQPNALDQFLGRATADYTQDWIGKLAAIRQVELSKTITPAAFKLAAMAALARQRLLDNATTPLVQLLPQTRLPRYGALLPTPTQVSMGSNSSLIWPAGEDFPSDPKWVSNDGSITTLECAPGSTSTSPTTAQPSSPPRAQPSSPPRPGATSPRSIVSPRDAFADMSNSISSSVSPKMYTAVYVLGGAMLAAGAGLAALSAFREGSSERF